MPNALHEKPDELAVWLVIYETSVRNMDTYLKAAYEKYGEPEYSGERRSGKVVVWCNGCNRASVFEEPNLSFTPIINHIEIDLRNPHYQRAFEEFEERGKDKTPKF